MENKFKRVPAVEKCFKILSFLAKSKEPLGITEISKSLNLSKSTVYNIVYTLSDLHVLEILSSGRFTLGSLFYTLASVSGDRSGLIQLTHPYLELINEKTGLSVFLGVRSGLSAVLIDKVEADFGIRLTSEIGMTMPPLAGAGIKCMLSQLPEEKVESLLEGFEFRKYTERTIVGKEKFLEELRRIRESGIAYDFEEYIPGLIGLSVPVLTGSKNVQAAIWVVGLRSNLDEGKIEEVSRELLSVAKELNEISLKRKRGE